MYSAAIQTKDKFIVTDISILRIDVKAALQALYCSSISKVIKVNLTFRKDRFNFILCGKEFIQSFLPLVSFS